jgi:hypothetical protein
MYPPCLNKTQVKIPALSLCGLKNDTMDLVVQCMYFRYTKSCQQTAIVLQATALLPSQTSIISSLDSPLCCTPFSLHSIVVLLDRSYILVRALPYFNVFIVLAAATVLMLQEYS